MRISPPAVAETNADVPDDAGLVSGGELSDPTFESLTAERDRLRKALEESQATLSAVHNRIHCLPRVSDERLTKMIEEQRALNAAALTTPQTEQDLKT